MPRLIYTALFYLISPFYFLRLVWKGIENPDYLKRWSERLGFVNITPSGKDVLWVHAVSVGEVNASLPLLRSLIKSYKTLDILVTTTTPTGSEILIRNMGNRIKHQYIPIDLPYCINKFLKIWNPKALLLLETEVWPNIIQECNRRGIFTALVNARLSERSKKNYLKIKSLIVPTINKIDLLVAQYDSDLKRFKELSKHKKISLCGNLKYEVQIPKEMDDISRNIRENWSINGEFRPTLIAASTHEKEEEIVLTAFSNILKRSENALLILSPRHSERFSKVNNLVMRKGFKVARRSENENVSSEINVLLGDTMGELSFLYSVSDVAFVGGSLIDHGGQNLIEPAAMGKPICSGSSLRNFEEVASELKQAGALTVIDGHEGLSLFFLDLLENKDKLKMAGEASKSVFKKNKGVIDKIQLHLSSHFSNIFK